jgi:hypothetical protein
MDREKVIKQLENDAIATDTGYVEVPLWLFSEILAMLKEQEAVEPRRDANCVRMFRCGVCGEYVGFIDSDPGDPNKQYNYCRNCGHAVKWK